MSDFEEKLNQILSSPDAMEQIMSIARTLGIGNDSAPSEASSKPASTPSAPASTASNGSNTAGLLSLLGGGNNDSGGGIDPKMASMLLRLASAWNTPDDDKIALLIALRPFLKPERAEKMQRAMQIAKLSRVIRIALDSFKGEDVDV